VRDLDDAAHKLIQNSRSCEIITIAPDKFADILEPLKRFEIEMIRRFVSRRDRVPSRASARDARMIQLPKRAPGDRNQFRESESSKDRFAFARAPTRRARQKHGGVVIGCVGAGISDPGYSYFVLLDHFLRVHKLRRNGQSKFEHGFVSGSGGFLRKKSMVAFFSIAMAPYRARHHGGGGKQG
jgi:hypothetical protein